MKEKTAYNRAVALFHAANAKDPHQESLKNQESPERQKGENWPKELLYSHRMIQCLESFAPAASEELKLAACSQHIQRWEIPRKNYPEGRTGYLSWRSRLYSFHAEKAATILREAGYSESTVQRVQFLLQKKGLRNDSESQTLEDTVCLVFLQYYAKDFSEKHPKEKIYNILQKTWSKMSPKGKKAARTLDLPQSICVLLEKMP